MLCRSLFVLLYILFHLAIVLYVLLRYTDSDYHFGILRLFLSKYYPQRSLEFSCYSLFLSYSTWHWRYFVYLWWFLLFQLIMNHANHMISLPVFVCAVVLTLASSVRLFSLFLMCQNFICWCLPHSWSETIQHNTYYIHGINCRSRR